MCILRHNSTYTVECIHLFNFIHKNLHNRNHICIYTYYIRYYTSIIYTANHCLIFHMTVYIIYLLVYYVLKKKNLKIFA